MKKPKQLIKDRCSCKLTNRKKYECAKITIQQREDIFTKYWLLEKGEKQLFIGNLVDKTPVKQRVSCLGVESRRQNSFVYHLKPFDSQPRIKVCKRMFLGTLNVGEWVVHHCVSKISKSSNVVKEKHTQKSSRLTKSTDQRLQYF